MKNITITIRGIPYTVLFRIVNRTSADNFKGEPASFRKLSIKDTDKSHPPQDVSSSSKSDASAAGILNINNVTFLPSQIKRGISKALDYIKFFNIINRNGSERAIDQKVTRYLSILSFMDADAKFIGEVNRMFNVDNKIKPITLGNAISNLTKFRLPSFINDIDFISSLDDTEYMRITKLIDAQYAQYAPNDIEKTLLSLTNTEIPDFNDAKVRQSIVAVILQELAYPTNVDPCTPAYTIGTNLSEDDHTARSIICCRQIWLIFQLYVYATKFRTYLSDKDLETMLNFLYAKYAIPMEYRITFEPISGGRRARKRAPPKHASGKRCSSKRIASDQ